MSKHNIKPTFVRLMVGFALVNLVYSLGETAMGPWAVPVGVPSVPAASGNTATCDAKAFLHNFVQGPLLYATGLAFYHLLKVRFEVNDDVIVGYVEPIVHFVAWAVPIVTGSIMVAMEMSNPIRSMPGLCYIAELPPGCNEYDDVDCVRGEDWYVFCLLCSALFAAICVVVTAASFVMIYCKVRSTERRMARYGESAHGGSSSRSRMEMSRQTGRHALGYIGAYMVCALPMFVDFAGPPSNTAVNPDAADFYLPMDIFLYLLLPLHGFLQACILLRSHPFVFRVGGPLHFVTRVRKWGSKSWNGSTASLYASIFFTSRDISGPIEDESAAAVVSRSASPPELTISAV